MSISNIVTGVEVTCGAIGVTLAFLQVMRLREGYPILRFLTYAAFTLTLGGVAFGKYYAGTAPKRLMPIETSSPSAAIAGYSDAIRFSPTDADLYFRRGRTQYHLLKYPEAIRDFSKALDLSPNKPEYLVSRGFAYFAVGDVRSAESDFNRALGSGYQSPEANLAYGMILENDGKFQEAINKYTAALSRSDLESANRCSALTSRANAYRGLKMYAEAERDDTDVIASCDKVSREGGVSREDGFVNRGTDKYLAGDHAGALADWEEALRLDPNDAVVFKNRAEMYMDDDRPELALADYNRYLQIRPDDAYSYSVRAGIYERLGDSSRAQVDRETGQELARTNRSKSYAAKSYYPQ
jgi:tetratricopeptide (TPR) repeat protein